MAGAYSGTSGTANGTGVNMPRIDGWLTISAPTYKREAFSINMFDNLTSGNTFNIAQNHALPRYALGRGDLQARPDGLMLHATNDATVPVQHFTQARDTAKLNSYPITAYSYNYSGPGNAHEYAVGGVQLNQVMAWFNSI